MTWHLPTTQFVFSHTCSISGDYPAREVQSLLDCPITLLNGTCHVQNSFIVCFFFFFFPFFPLIVPAFMNPGKDLKEKGCNKLKLLFFNNLSSLISLEVFVQVCKSRTYLRHICYVNSATSWSTLAYWYFTALLFWNKTLGGISGHHLTAYCIPPAPHTLLCL